MEPEEHSPDGELHRKISREQNRKMRAQRASRGSEFWLGLSMFGLIGWSVAIPTLIVTAIGLWLDTRTESGISWTATGVFVGAALGCLNAWYWIKREGKNE
jgi:ATP synthase protein I